MSTISALSESQVLAIGGWTDALTFLRWLRSKKEFIKAITGAFDEFTRSTTWGDRLAIVGRLLDSLLPVLGTIPTESDVVVISALQSGEDDNAFIAHELEVSQQEFEALGINWGGLVEKLPQIMAFLQFVGGLVTKFKGPQGAVTASVVVPPIHGLVYTPFAAAA